MIKVYYSIKSGFSKLLLTAGFLSAMSAIVSAQAPAETLQKGVEIYNALQEYTKGLQALKVTDEQLDDVKSRMDSGLPLFDQVIKQGSAEEIRVARYFRANLQYQYGFTLGLRGDSGDGYEAMKKIEPEMIAFKATDFPMKYQFFDKNYVINWKNFELVQAKYIATYGEMAYNVGEYENAVRLNRMLRAHPSATTWLKYVMLNMMLDLYEKAPQYINEVEWLDAALQQIKTYYMLDEQEIQALTANSIPTGNRGLEIILDKAKAKTPAALARAGEAALAGSPDTASTDVLGLFQVCYENKQTTTADFDTRAEKYARGMRAKDDKTARYVGLAATSRMALTVQTTDCTALEKIIGNYTFWHESAKVSEYTRKRQACLEEQVKAQKRAERIARRANRRFNFYTGMYVFPLFKDNSHRDYGGVVNLSFRKFALEFSYLDIRLNKDNVFDLTLQGVDDVKNSDISRWNGYYAHFQPKFFSGKGAYFGPLLGYSQKNFEAISANVTKDDSGVYSNETFKPVEKQYILMANFGFMMLGRGIGADFYMGIGGTYNQWDWGNPLHNDEYTVDNLVLENRKKGYLNLIFRVGMTAGLNFGRGNK